MDKIDPEDLKKFNGQTGSRTYIAYRGKVYDVSQSFFWRGGKHWVLHDAGQDLTEAMREAPHNEDLLERVPLIGILAEGE
jgi:predicted heme/steroid binding protein